MQREIVNRRCIPYLSRTDLLTAKPAPHAGKGAPSFTRLLPLSEEWNAAKFRTGRDCDQRDHGRNKVAIVAVEADLFKELHMDW